MKIVNTHGWEWAQLAPYSRAITAHLQKLQDRFPDDVTALGLTAQFFRGEKALWLVLDDENEVQMIGATQIRTVDATGKKIAVLCDLAGDDVASCSDELCEAMEAWAKEQGADLMAVEGRAGWSREMNRRGYREYARLWRKEVA